MCGILGLYDLNGQLGDPERFDRALERLHRRGPDDSGTWSDAFVRLGHRRLAIVDLTPTGHQPLLSSDGRFAITFNGEIYNHAELRQHLTPAGSWRGTSDTETLVEAYRKWGVRCVDHLQGMFAFAIWDREERRLFLARDRIGKKPLYYSLNGSRLSFGSRPGAVMALDASKSSAIDTESLRLFLELGYIPSPRALYHGLRKLPAAHYALADARGLRVVRYWDYRHIPVDEALLGRREDDLIDELQELVERSVRARLMSDVPLGAFLSGGTDSAVVVTAMRSVATSDPKSFTIRFREPAYDEGPTAGRIASQLGVAHTAETVSVNELVELLPLYVAEFDEPLADTSAFSTMAVARLARRQVAVALSGDGGDELFGGYHYYALMERITKTAAWPVRLRESAARAIRRLPAHRAKLLAGALLQQTPVALFNYMRSFAKDFPSLLASDLITARPASEDLFEQVAASFAMDLSPADAGMRLDTAFTLPDQYLQKVDVATMAFSLEARCPLLDHSVVEWAMRLPVAWKLRNGQRKYLLKQMLCRTLPSDIVRQPKKGFGLPIASWLRGPLNGWATELLYDDTTIGSLPLDAGRIRELFSQHLSGRRDAHPLLWAVLMLICYVRHHEQALGLPEVRGTAAAA